VSRDFPEGPLERFLEDLAALGVPGSSRGILIAVSGGADSTALCRLLSAAREREGRRGSWPALWVGHVHHGLRGEEADADLAFTRELAESLGLGFLEARADVRALARGRGLSIEAAARSARYAVFAGWARDHDLDDLVLGHTASDQAETVLLRVLRRAGLRGLRGMPRERPLCFHQPGPRPRIVRPLLSWTRAEILDYLTALGQHHREDSSNLDPSFLRNRVRHVLLPRLRLEEPAIEQVLLRLAGLAGRLWQVIEPRAREALESAVRGRNGGEIRLSREKLAGLPPGFRSTALYLAVEELSGVRTADQLPTPIPRQLAAVASWAEDARARRGPQDLGTGLTAELRGDSLILVRPAETTPAPAPPLGLAVPGSTAWGSWQIRAEPIPPAEAAHLKERFLEFAREGAPKRSPRPADRLSEVLDRSALEGSLVVRSRLAGDRYRPLGSPGSKKLKELLRECRVDPKDRNAVPVLADAKGIVWVVGHRLADRCRLRPNTQEVLRLGAARLIPVES